MLYTDLELNDPNNKETAITRYLHKFSFHRKEIKKLKLHEKHFLFLSMASLITVTDEGKSENLTDFDSYEAWKYLEGKGLAKKAFDLFEIEEAEEYMFYRIVLNYYDNLYFLSPVIGPFGPLSKEEIEKDKFFFNAYFMKWQSMLFSNKGTYFPHLLNEFNRKVKMLEESRKLRLVGYHQFLNKEKELKLTCFHIYYRVKYFFDGYGKTYYKMQIGDLVFVFDVFSYVHILSRHYMPTSNNFYIDISFNEELPFIDIYNLPISIEEILVEFNRHRKLLPTDEYIIIAYRNSFYILWIKFGYLDSLKEDCFHIRSLYKITAKRDYDRLVTLIKVQIAYDLFFYV